MKMFENSNQYNNNKILDKNNALTVCFISHSSGIAGAEKAFPKLIDGLKKKGVLTYVLLPENGPVEHILKISDIQYKIVRYSRWINFDSIFLNRVKRSIKSLLAVIVMIRIIRKWRCDIVYTNTSTIVSGAIAARILQLPHIWHFREFGVEDYGLKYDIGARISQWLTKKLSSVYLTNSVAVKEKYATFIPSEKIQTIYEAYENTNLSEDQGSIIIKKAKFNCIIIGTLHEAKGHKDAIRAIKELQAVSLDIKLFIVGTGDLGYIKQLTILVRELGIDNMVEFLGHVNNPQGVLKQCDVLLMCSRNEAFGLVTLEAMKLGIPVIGTNSGGTKELIIDRFNGLLYNPGDFLSLALGIKHLLENPNKKNQMGANAKTWSDERFKPENYINETLQLLNQTKKSFIN